MSSDLEGTSTWNDGLVLDGVLDGTETITDGVLGLSDGVIVWSLDKDGAGEGVLDTLDEGVFVFSEVLLVDELGKTEIAFLDIVHRVDLLTTASERNSLTVSSLGTSDANDVVAGEDFEGRRVNTLLVDDDKVLVGAITKSLLELNDFQNAVIGELTLRFNQLLSLIGVAPEESGVDLGFFVLERDVEAHDVAVLQSRGHVALSATVVEDETANQLGLSRHLVLHVHDFDHMEIDLIIAHNSFDGINNDFSKRVSDRWVDLSVKRAAGDADEEVSGHLVLSLLEFLKELKSLFLGLLQTINDDSRVDSLTEVAFGLAHELSDEKHIGCGAVTDDVILGSGSSANHGSGRVLDLHLMEQNTTILGQLDLTGTTDEPN